MSPLPQCGSSQNANVLHQGMPITANGFFCYVINLLFPEMQPPGPDSPDGRGGDRTRRAQI
jgi:hypothetical protein